LGFKKVKKKSKKKKKKKKKKKIIMSLVTIFRRGQCEAQNFRTTAFAKQFAPDSDAIGGFFSPALTTFVGV